MKKMTIALSALSFFVLASTALAQGSGQGFQGFVPLAPITGLTDPATLSVANSSKNLASFFNNLYKYAIGLAAVLAVIQIIWAGINIALHQDNVSSITDSKGKIYNAIFGLVLVLSPVLVFSIINPNILNLSLALPVLNRAAPSVTTGVTAGVTPPAQDPALAAATKAGCVIITSTPQAVSCPNQTAAQSFVDACVTKGGTGSVSSLPLSSKYQATCSTAAGIACTTARAGTYLETAVCASWLDTARYKCTGAGLTLQIPPHDCKTTVDSATGNCMDTSYTVYCIGKEIPVVDYAFYNKLTVFSGLGASGAAVIPRDKSAADAFVAGCQGDGGTWKATVTAASSVFLTSRAYLVSNGCPSDAGIPPYDATKYSGVVCYNTTLSCNSPTK